MTPSNHTTSLELSIALKKAGWPQEESLFYWSSATSKDFRLIYLTDYRSVDNPYDDHLKDLLEDGSDEVVSSPTASELMERMPYRCPMHGGGMNICTSFGGGWFVGYGNHQNSEGCHVEEDADIPDALAKLALHLIQEGIIKF